MQINYGDGVFDSAIVDNTTSIKFTVSVTKGHDL